jgi:hypothetical protein
MMSHEAHFHMSGYVNKYNCQFWGANKPHELQHCLHGEKVTVRCTNSSGGITGPYFFENGVRQTVTVNAE